MVFALVDLEFFKQVNDTHGHAAGDQILKQISELLVRMVREGDYVVRWGGEEFLIVFRPMPKEQPSRIAERIRAAVEQTPFSVNDSESLDVTCSLGFSEYPASIQHPGELGWEEIVELADQALYYVKENGRNGWCIVRPDDNIRPTTLRKKMKGGVQGLLASGYISMVSSVAR